MLPDWAAALDSYKSQGDYQQSFKQSIQQQLHLFMGAEKEEMQMDRDKGKDARVYSVHRLCALDKALQAGLDLNLNYFFLPVRQKMGQLRMHQERYYVAVEHLDVDSAGLYQEEEGEQEKRSCIIDHTTKETWLEAPRDMVAGQLHRPCLWAVSDKGPKCFPGLQWLFQHGHLRGAVIPDPWHQDWNGLRAALDSYG